MAELDAERIGEALVARQLAAVIGLDAVAREGERVERGARALRRGGVDLPLRHAEVRGLQIDAVEFPGEFDERRIPAGRNVGDDRAHHLLDVGRSLALGGEESGKALAEIAGAGVEADRHGRPG